MFRIWNKRKNADFRMEIGGDYSSCRVISNGPCAAIRKSQFNFAYMTENVVCQKAARPKTSIIFVVYFFLQIWLGNLMQIMRNNRNIYSTSKNTRARRKGESTQKVALGLFSNSLPHNGAFICFTASLVFFSVSSSSPAAPNKK